MRLHDPRGLRIGAMALVAAVLTGLGLTGCGGSHEPEPAIGLAIAVSRHANMPAVPVSELQQLIPDRLPGGSRVVIIGIDGSADGVPIYDKTIKRPEDPNAADPLAPEEAATSVAGRLKPKFEASSADTAESDPYAAIARAALGIREVEGTKKLVIMDSMVHRRPDAAAAPRSRRRRRGRLGKHRRGRQTSRI